MKEDRYYVQRLTEQVFLVRERLSSSEAPGANDHLIRSFDIQHDAALYADDANEKQVWTLDATRYQQRELVMETTTDGTFFKEGDRVCLKRTREMGRVNATDGGVVYVLMDTTNETRLFSAYVDEDAYIELVPPEIEKTA